MDGAPEPFLNRETPMRLVLAAGLAALAAGLVIVIAWHDLSSPPSKPATLPTNLPTTPGPLRQTVPLIETESSPHVSDTLPPPAFSDSFPGNSFNGGNALGGFGGVPSGSPGGFMGGFPSGSTGAFCGGQGGLPHPEHLRPGVQGGPVEVR